MGSIDVVAKVAAIIDTPGLRFMTRVSGEGPPKPPEKCYLGFLVVLQSINGYCRESSGSL